jgi:hypothetical protein
VTDSSEQARRQAQQDYYRNQQQQMATEQAFGNADTRNAYNAELDRQRRTSGKG